MNWYTLNQKLEKLEKSHVLIYDDNHEDGNQYINVMHKDLFQFKITRPQMNKLKRLGYKVKRRTIKK